MSEKTDEQISDLVYAMFQLLDDMGKDNLCVSEWAKANARIAFEPWLAKEDSLYFMSLDEAKEIVREREL